MAKAVTSGVTVKIGDTELSDPNLNEHGYPKFIPQHLWNYCQSMNDLDIRFGYFGMWNGSHFNMNMNGGNHKVVICLNQVKELAKDCETTMEMAGITVFAHEMGHYFDMNARYDLYKARSSFRNHMEMEVNRHMVIDCELGANYELMKLAEKFNFTPSMTLLHKGLKSQKATEEDLGILYDIIYHNREYVSKYQTQLWSPDIEWHKKLVRHHRERPDFIIRDEATFPGPKLTKEYTAKERKKLTKDHFKEVYNGRFDERTRRARDVYKRKF